MDLETQLTNLETADLVRRAKDAELSYQFRHGLTQDTVYASLLRSKRRDIHRRVAETIEVLYPDRLDENAALLAQHYAEAGDETKILQYATRAGDQAARIYANAEAIALYSQALNVAHDPVHIQDLRLKCGRVLELIGKYSDALANYAELEAQARDRSDQAMELAALMALASIYALGGMGHDAAKAQEHCDRALALARELGDHTAQARILWILLFLNTYLTNQPRRAVEYGEQSLAIARQYDLREQMAYALHNLSYALLQTGQMGATIAAATEARKLWRELGNLSLLADNLAFSGINELIAGRAKNAPPLVEEALTINRTIGSPWGLCMSGLMIGVIEDEALQPARALEAFQECIAAGEKVGAAGMVASARARRAWVVGSLGATRQGIKLAQEAVVYARQNYPHWEAWPRAVLVRIYLLEGNLGEAENAGAELWSAPVMQYFERFIPPGAMAVAVAQVELVLARKEFGRATDLASELREFVRTSGFVLFMPEALYCEGRILHALNRFDEAYGVYRQSLEQAKLAGARQIAWRALAAQSEIDRQRGNKAKAHALGMQAREISEEIVANSPPDLKNVFRERVQTILKE
jgi:tetratricopeptide (TPR) repeat protein